MRRSARIASNRAAHHRLRQCCCSDSSSTRFWPTLYFASSAGCWRPPRRGILHRANTRPGRPKWSGVGIAGCSLPNEAPSLQRAKSFVPRAARSPWTGFNPYRLKRDKNTASFLKEFPSLLVKGSRHNAGWYPAWVLNAGTSEWQSCISLVRDHQWCGRNQGSKCQRRHEKCNED